MNVLSCSDLGALFRLNTCVYSSVGSGVCPYWKPHNKVYIITYFSAAELLIPGS